MRKFLVKFAFLSSSDVVIYEDFIVISFDFISAVSSAFKLLGSEKANDVYFYKVEYLGDVDYV